MGLSMIETSGNKLQCIPIGRNNLHTEIRQKKEIFLND